MLSICLKNIVFNSFHGINPGEKETGGRYVVNLKTSFMPTKDTIQNIEETINYERLFLMVTRRMVTPTGLIETLAMQIVDDIRLAFPVVFKIAVNIEKCNPPIPYLEGSILVEYTWSKPGFGF